MQRKWEAQWKKMTVEQQFAFRGLVQHVLKEKLEARKADIDRRLHSLKPPRGHNDPIKVPRSQG